jgi:hypothetical protein
MPVFAFLPAGGAHVLMPGDGVTAPVRPAGEKVAGGVGVGHRVGVVDVEDQSEVEGRLLDTVRIDHAAESATRRASSTR